MKTGRRRVRFVLASVGVLVVVWIAYKAMTIRRMSGRLTVDTGCESDPNTVAGMSQFTPGAASIRCAPWDIGTGVTGYVWHAPNPQAVLLIEHGWGDYAQRYVKQSSQLVPHLLARGISVYAIDMWGNGARPDRAERPTSTLRFTIISPRGGTCASSRCRYSCSGIRLAAS